MKLEPSTATPPDDKVALGRYFPGLDGIRAWIVLCVVVFHVQPDWMPGAPMVMDMFFTISGFLITGVIHRNVQRSGRIQLLTFWKRRLWRLYPVLTLVVASYCAIAFALRLDMRPITQDAWQTLLYVSNFPKLHEQLFPTIFSHSWSLSVEEQFYLIWPVLLLLALKTSWYDRRGCIVLVAVALADTVWRNWLLAQGAPWPRLYYAFDTRIDAFVLSSLLAFGWQT